MALGFESGDRTLSILKGFNLTSRVALTIRHSEREKGDSEHTWVGDLEKTRPLTTRGRDLARRFGSLLPPFKNLYVSSTPVPRAMDTAALIVEGFREAHTDSNINELRIDSTLSPARHHARDMESYNHLRQVTPGALFIRKWLDGEIDSTLLASPPMAIGSYVRTLTNRVSALPASSLHIGVSHDYDLIVMREVLFGGKFEQLPWIEYLDGLFFEWPKSEVVRVRWRTHEVELHL